MAKLRSDYESEEIDHIENIIRHTRYRTWDISIDEILALIPDLKGRFSGLSQSGNTISITTAESQDLRQHIPSGREQ